jgi:threonine/homoserine/homoserine lactone efflux protein
MAASSITAFWAVSILLVLVPGADWAYAMAAGLRDRSVLPAVGGLLIGYVGLTGVVAAGVAAVVARTPGVLLGLTVAGALYLVWLGAATLARSGGLNAEPPVSEPPASGTGAWGSRMLKGAGISGLNPKALLLFLALLPQFTDRADRWPLAAQIGALGLVHVFNCAVVYACVGVLARAILRARPAAARAVTRFSGVAMIVIGVLLAADRF